MLVWYDEKRIDGQDLARLINRIVSRQMAAQLYGAFLSLKANTGKGENAGNGCSYLCRAKKILQGNVAGLGRNRIVGNSRILENKGRGDVPFTGAAIHAVMDVVVHAVLPKPLNVFAPMVIKALTGRN